MLDLLRYRFLFWIFLHLLFFDSLILLLLFDPLFLLLSFFTLFSFSNELIVSFSPAHCSFFIGQHHLANGLLDILPPSNANHFAVQGCIISSWRCIIWV